MAKKYIIENGTIIAASAVDFHRELKSSKLNTPKEEISGGWWEHEKDEITFYGKSEDFGPAKKEDIIDALKNERINQRRWIGLRFFHSNSKLWEQAFYDRVELKW